MLERHVGRDRILREAIDILIPEAYNEALEEEDIDAIGQPDIELTQDEPLAFKATVPIRPTVELGDYRKLSVERQPVEVDPADVDASIEELRHRYAIHEPVERAVQPGDIVRGDVRMVIDGQEVFHDEDAEFQLKDGATILLPGFAEGLVGAKKGVQKEIPVSVPPGERPLSGKSGTATVTLQEVKQEVLPDLDEAFAQQVGEGFPTVDALRQRLSDDMRERLAGQAEESFRDEAVRALADEAHIEFPPLLIDREMERLINDQARSTGQDVEHYLQMIRKTPAQMKDELRVPAAERVRRSLALTQLSADESIEVEAPEVDAEIERLAGSSGEQAAQVRQLFASPEARGSIERSLLTRKTLDRLVEIVSKNGEVKAAVPAKKSGDKKKSKAKAAVKEAS
jgi:trigger factor